MEHRLPRKLAAILYADVAGYSRLTGADEDATHQTLSDYLGLISGIIESKRGNVMHYAGDAVLAKFDAVVNAVSAAVAIQHELKIRNEELPDERKVQFRMGVNLGDVIEDRGDIYGEGVNVAARLEGLAEPGGICVSASVHTAVLNKFPVGYEDLGQQVLKNIESPIHAYRIVNRAEGSSHAQSVDAISSSFEFTQQARPPSLAILPFKNLSGDPSHDYISDGLNLGVRSSLVQLSGLFLVNATAVEVYRDTKVQIAQAAREMGVRYVLEGAVQVSGETLRATFQLTDASTDAMVWAEKYDRELEDLFKLQDEITQEVIIALDVQILGRESDRVWFRKHSGPKARELLLRGLSHLYKLNHRDNAESRRLYEELYRLQPESGSFSSGIVALTHWFDMFLGWTDQPAQSKEWATQWAHRAVAHGDDTGFGHAVLGHLQLLEGNHRDALENCRVAADMRTSCPLANGLLGLVQNYHGDYHGAVNSARTARVKHFETPVSGSLVSICRAPRARDWSCLAS